MLYQHKEDLITMLTMLKEANEISNKLFAIYVSRIHQVDGKKDENEQYLQRLPLNQMREVTKYI